MAFNLRGRERENHIICFRDERNLTIIKQHDIKKTSSGAGDYTDGESLRPNSRKRKRQESMKSEARYFVFWVAHEDGNVQ